MAFFADTTNLERLLERLCVAVESLHHSAFPPTPDPGPIHIATEADLHFTDQGVDLERSEALASFCWDNQCLLDSTIFYAKMVLFEHDVVELYGEEALDSLAWNKKGRRYWSLQKDYQKYFNAQTGKENSQAGAGARQSGPDHKG